MRFLKSSLDLSNICLMLTMLQTIQIKLMHLYVWADQVVLGSAKTALKFEYEI